MSDRRDRGGSVSLHIFRATVRGRFAALDDETRARLVAEAGAHEVFAAAFTATGTFTYEPSLNTFTLRYEVREDGDDAAEMASRRALGAAAAYLDERGIGHTHLRVALSDMADVWSDRKE